MSGAAPAQGAGEANRVLALWRRLSRMPFGRWLFARAVCLRAPYFRTIRPRFEELRPGHARIAMDKRRSVENHIGTVHAIAMCNLCELAAGTVTEVSIPAAMRWLPRGMTVEYLRRAASGVVAACDFPEALSERVGDVPVRVDVTDASGTLVCRAVITMYLSPRRTA